MPQVQVVCFVVYVSTRLLVFFSFWMFVLLSFLLVYWQVDLPMGCHEFPMGFSKIHLNSIMQTRNFWCWKKKRGRIREEHPRVEGFLTIHMGPPWFLFPSWNVPGTGAHCAAVSSLWWTADDVGTEGCLTKHLFVCTFHLNYIPSIPSLKLT